MPLWKPDQRWAGADVFIVGGGPSLAGFDWSLLHGKNTIGCNAAFKLGVDVCKVCFFSDQKWFQAYETELSTFTGEVVTHCPRLLPLSFRTPWLKGVRREKRGLHQKAIGFGGNSGCSAVNLALLMGAKRVFLLGFDCKVEDVKQTHWHKWTIEQMNLQVFPKFIQGWGAIAVDLPTVFPGCEIINLNPDSAIPFFPKAEPRAYLSHNLQEACA
jgi:hypothetical protein